MTDDPQSSTNFDVVSFCEWVDERDGPIRGDVLDEEWPAFPSSYLVGVTGVIVDGGELAYYTHDLKRAVREWLPRD